jgi:DNA repair exonuclease SbcCD ATPase subunit
MKIIELRSENVKKVKAIEIKPKDNVVIISGKNGAGKTSVLDSIWFALEGGAGLKGTPMPIRRGEKKAEIKLTLDDFIVTRKWTDNNKTYLKVTNREGLSYSSPQELLDKFIGKLTFDPLSFCDMSDKEQRELLLKLAGLDFTEVDNKAEEIREKRRLQGQKVKLLSGEREEITIKDLPELQIDTSKLSNKYDKAISLNNEIVRGEEKLRNNVDSINDGIKNINEKKEEIKKLQQEIEDMKEKIEVIKVDNTVVEGNNKKIKEWLSENKPINTEDIKEELRRAYNINEQIKVRERNKEADKKQEEAQNVYDNHTDELQKLIDGKKDSLQKAKMPISGLNIDENITYNDIPYSQLALSESLKVNMAIAMALNKKLRVILVKDASLLDEDNMKIIEEMAGDNDYQVWLEKVDDTGKIGFYIEEGEIKKK